MAHIMRTAVIVPLRFYKKQQNMSNNNQIQLNANFKAISSDTHQLQLTKLHHFKLEIFK